MKGTVPSEPIPIEESPVEEGESLPPWTLSTPPDEYLKRYPKAKNADLARQHVAAGK